MKEKKKKKKKEEKRNLNEMITGVVLMPWEGAGRGGSTLYAKGNKRGGPRPLMSHCQFKTFSVFYILRQFLSRSYLAAELSYFFKTDCLKKEDSTFLRVAHQVPNLQQIPNPVRRPV